jgi:hypothetical protein
VLLQSAYPELHDAILHVPLAHVPTPCATVQAWPHAPQFSASVLRFVVQPPPEQAAMGAEQLE